MKVWYLDTGLLEHLGHQANYCRHITREMQRRGVDLQVYGHHSVVSDLRDELRVVPLFRCHTYRPGQMPVPCLRTDPLCMWLAYFEMTWQITRRDLDEIREVGNADVVYMNSATAPQLMAAVNWLSSFPTTNRPRVVIELGIGASDRGIGFGPYFSISRFASATSSQPDEVADCRSFLYRYVGMHLHGAMRPSLSVATFHSATSEAYRRLLSYPVETFPFPHNGITNRASRVRHKPFTISVLGNQRPEKGFEVVPIWAALLLARRTDIRIRIHNGAPQSMANEQGRLREIAAREPRLMLTEGAAGPDLWRHLLEETDLIVCPYKPEAFVTKHSAVVAEAIANGIPVVVPDRTCLSTLLAQFGGPGRLFAEFSPDSVLSATQDAIDDLDRLSLASEKAAEQWQQEQGARPLVDAILGIDASLYTNASL